MSQFSGGFAREDGEPFDDKTWRIVHRAEKAERQVASLAKALRSHELCGMFSASDRAALAGLEAPKAMSAEAAIPGDGKWHKVVATYDQGNISIKVDP